MESLGSFLKSERERQHKSLHDIAEVTRISKSTLAAIEEGKPTFLPPQSYVKGFLRLYARELALDPDEIVQRYDLELMDTKWGAQRELKAADMQRAQQRRALRIGVGILALLSLLFTAYLLQTRQKPPAKPDHTTIRTEPAPQPDVDAGMTADGDALPGMPSSALDTTAGNVETLPAAALPENFTIRFEARELTWIRIAADGEPPFEIMLRQGESYSRTARSRMDVRIGNTAGVDIHYNDTLVEYADGPGRPMDIVFPEAAQRR
jgi:transcriptional regulator with XRE-family HTH domain